MASRLLQIDIKPCKLSAGITKEVFPITKFLAFGLAAACAALAQEAIPYSLDCHRLILVDESHYFETIDVFDDYDIDFDVIGNF